MYLFITIFRHNLVVDISNRNITFPYNANYYYYYYIMYIYNLLKINKNVVTFKILQLVLVVHDLWACYRFIITVRMLIFCL